MLSRNAPSCIQSEFDANTRIKRELQGSQNQEQDGLGITVEQLPHANVTHIMKTALPENAKISKETKDCMQECVSEFISFITSEAAEECREEKRKTIAGEDIISAMDRKSSATIPINIKIRVEEKGGAGREELGQKGRDAEKVTYDIKVWSAV